MKNKVKLHLGCGKVYIPGFIHIDLDEFEHIDYRHDIKHLPMIEDNSVDYIYCCHALEYYERPVAMIALNHWYEKLKKGGILRIAVPDFAAIVKVYQKYKNIEHRGILGPLYGELNIGHLKIFHKTVYDFKSLKKMLEELGYHKIKRYDWRETEHSHIDDFSQAYIPHMDKENGTLISLNMEAIK